MSPASRRPRAARMFLCPPPSSHSGRSSRRSSFSMSVTDGQTNMIDPSIAVPPTSQTGDSIHRSALGDSLYWDTRDAAIAPDAETDYTWESTVTAVGNSHDPVNDQQLFSHATAADSNAVLPYSANTNGNMPNLNLSSNNADALFRFVIRTIQRNYSLSPHPAQYAMDLAVATLGPEVVEDYQRTIQQPAVISGMPPAPDSSTPHRSGYKCKLCNSSQIFRAGSFKRHVSEQHRAKSYFYCLEPSCSYRHVRKHRAEDHLMRNHPGEKDPGRGPMVSEVLEPIPEVCNICADLGLREHIGPFVSWDTWYKGIESHCLILIPVPSNPANDPSLPSYHGGGGGAGGYGGSTGYGSASPGQQGASQGGLFPPSIGNPDIGPAWSNLPQYGLTVPRHAAPVDHLANRPRSLSLSGNPSLSQPKVSHSKQSIQQPFHDLETRRRMRIVGGNTSRNARCSRRKHVYGSCFGCPPNQIQGYRHLWEAQHTRASVLKEQAATIVDADHKRFANLRSSVMEVPRSDAMSSIVFSMKQLSLVSRSVSQPTRTSDYPQNPLDAPITERKMLVHTLENSPGWSEKVLKQITHCQAALDAIKSEITTSPPFVVDQKARQRRLSSLWARLRAVAFVLSLPKEAISTDIQTEKSEKNSDDINQITLFRSIGCKAPPLTFLDLSSLYHQIYEHFYEDFWGTSCLYEVRDEDEERLDTDSPMTFLRAMVMTISVPQSSSLKDYVRTRFLRR